MKLILASDNHLRPDVPTCRLETPDEWKAFQKARIVEIVEYANTYGADIVFGGDIFDVPRVPPEIVSILIDALSPLLGKAYFLAGNHSLPFHRESNVMSSSIGIIKAIAGDGHGQFVYLEPNEEIIDGRFEHSHRLNDEVTVVHTLAFPTEDDIPFACDGVTADYLFKKYDTPFILLGDMHRDFVVQDGERFVVNSGCMTIQSANEIDYAPCVYYIDTGERIDVSVQGDKAPVFRQAKSTVRRLPLTNAPEMLTIDHLTARRERDERIAQAIEVLSKEGNRESLSFLATLIQCLEENGAYKKVDGLLEELKEEYIESCR